MIWQDFISNLPNVAGKATVQDVQNLLTALRGNAAAAAKEVDTKVTKYLSQLANGEIDKQDFEDDIESAKGDLKAELDEMSVEVRAATQKVIGDLEQVLVQGIVMLL